MKFTKKEAFEKLKGELTKGGKTLRLTERTINEMLDTLMPLVGNDDLELDSFATNVFPMFNTANGNMEKDYSDFVKNYKPAKTEETKTPPSDTGGDNELKTLKQKLEAIEASMAQKKKEEAVTGIRKSIKTALKSKGVKDDDWIDTFLPEITITEDFKVEDKIDSYVKLYNKSKADMPPGMTPYTPVGDASGDFSKIWDDLKPKKD